MNDRTPNQPDQKRRFYLGIALCVGLVVILGAWDQTIRERNAALAAELAALETKSTGISARLAESIEARPRLLAALARPEHVLRERKAPKWSQALGDVDATTGAAVELRDLHAREKLATPGACELRIDGVALGQSPRMAADRFRKRLEADLRRDFPKSVVTTRFVDLENEQNAQVELAERKANFTIKVTVGDKDQLASNAPGNL